MKGSTEDILKFQDEEVVRMAKVEEVNKFFNMVIRKSLLNR